MIITLVWTNNYRRNHVLESVLEIWTVEAGLLDTNITALWIAGGLTEVLSVLLTQPRAVSLVCLVILIMSYHLTPSAPSFLLAHSPNLQHRRTDVGGFREILNNERD